MTDDYPVEIRRIVARIEPGWPQVVEVGRGWYPLLGRLDERLRVIAPNYVVQQVKEKFGSLSFFARASMDPYDYNDEFHEVIRAAEWESTETCEDCGAPARTYVFRLWVCTVCEHHAKERRKATGN